MEKTNREIEYIKGVGPTRAKNLSRLGLNFLEDLVYYFPKGYEDRSKIVDFRNIKDDGPKLVKGITINKVENRYIRKNLSIQKLNIITDNNYKIEITWFNQRYLVNTIKPNTDYYFFGEIEYKFGRFVMNSPEYEEATKCENMLKILPVYPLTRGITQNVLRNIQRIALDEYLKSFEKQEDEVFDESFLKSQNIITKRHALKEIHFPSSFEDREKARYRIAYDELFFLSLALGELKKESRQKNGPMFSKEISLSDVINDLPFKLTGAQLNSLEEIEKDLESDKAMNRLLQGDVGSGKTIVSVLSMYKAVKSGYQAAFLAPTSILVSQHYDNIKKVLDKYNINIEVLKSELPKKEKQEIKERIKSGEVDIVIGTHALLQEDVEFKNLGLVITDEQHRFGVKQREAIISKGNNPNTLVMSATPIPRTLAFILYGDLDISVIDEMPVGRKPVKTTVVDEKNVENVDIFMRNEIKKGGQIYVVCPLVEESEDLNLNSVEEKYAEYKKRFNEYTVRFIHGKMKEKEKNEIMQEFKQGNIDILVSTTVIEVGVDVANANLMVIENAERFGLAQLHQLRGRVGRGDKQGYCILKTKRESLRNPVTRQRLKVMVETTNGFKIAEKDLELRGHGDFFGTRQHGLPEFKMANLFEDIDILKKAQSEAVKILDNNLLKTEEYDKINREVNKILNVVI